MHIKNKLWRDFICVVLILRPVVPIKKRNNDMSMDNDS